MRQHSKKIIILGCFIALIVLLGIVFYQIRENRRPKEILVVWGQHGDQCRLWIIDPQAIVSGPFHSVSGEQSCNYMLAEIDDKATLIHVHSYPAMLTIYDINSDNISTKLILPVEGVDEITSDPQWDVHGDVYFSGIAGDEESIYRFNIQTRTLEKLISQPGNTVTNPSLSPDGKYLSYLVLEGFASRHECPGGFSECKFNGDYYVMNLTSNEHLALNSLLQLDFSTKAQHPVWSMEGHFLAVDIYSPPAPTAIIDIQENSLVKVIAESAGIYGWLPNAQLMYLDWSDARMPRTRVYNLESGASYDLLALSSGEEDGMWFLVENFDWTKDRQHIAGTIGNITGTTELITFSLSNGTPIVNTIGQHVTVPIPSQWSPSGNWIAFASANDLFAYRRGEESSINVIDKQGNIQQVFDLSEIKYPQFAWVQSH